MHDSRPHVVITHFYPTVPAGAAAGAVNLCRERPRCVICDWRDIIEAIGAPDYLPGEN